MSQTPSGIPPRRLPLVLGVTGVVIAAVVAISIAVNQADNAGVTPSLTPSAVAVTSASPLATPCNTAEFGAALQPESPPTDVHKYSGAPATQIDIGKLYEATIHTARGDIVLCLQPLLAPNTVNNFVVLARNHFYDGIPFHRVVAKFVIQGGDPNCINNTPPAPATPGTGCGGGGPGYSFNDEPVKGKYTTGCVAMANSGANTNGSQFFVCTADDTSLPASYNLFGTVASGLNVALQIQQGDVMESVTVKESQ